MRTKIIITMDHRMQSNQAEKLIQAALVQSDINVIGAMSAIDAGHVRQLAEKVDCSSVHLDMHECPKIATDLDVLCGTIGSIDEEVTGLKVEARVIQQRLRKLKAYRKRCVAVANKALQVKKFIDKE